MQVFSFCQLYSKILHYLLFDFTILNQYLSITDLPPHTKLTDLSKLADLDMNKLPHPEESGDRCIRRIQEFLINEMSSTECGVLPEDKLQRLVVGVSTLSFFQQTFLQTRVWLFVVSILLQTQVHYLCLSCRH